MAGRIGREAGIKGMANRRNSGSNRRGGSGGSGVGKVLVVMILIAVALVSGRGIGNGSGSNGNGSVDSSSQNGLESVIGDLFSDPDGDRVSNSAINEDGGQASTGNDTGTAGMTSQSGSYQWTQWNVMTAPNAYRMVGSAVVNRDVEAGSIQYDGFDSLGRTQRAVGNVTYDMVEESAGWRADFKSDVDGITGWKGNNHKIADAPLPNGKTYSGYCYNRSHLIGDCLGGYEHVYANDGTVDQRKSKSEKQNLVTGTRFQNVGADGKGGMAYCENLVMDYLTSHRDVSVYYSATPVYDGSDLVCRSVFVDIRSSDGGLDQEVEVYNVQPGCTIDYATGVLAQD